VCEGGATLGGEGEVLALGGFGVLLLFGVVMVFCYDG